MSTVSIPQNVSSTSTQTQESTQTQDFRFVSRDGSVVEYQISAANSKSRNCILVLGSEKELLSENHSIIRCSAIPGSSLHRQAKLLDELVYHLRESLGIKATDLVVYASPDVAIPVTAWVHDYAPNLKALVLNQPEFRGLQSEKQTCNRIVEDAGAIAAATLLISSSNVSSAEARAQRKFYLGLSSIEKQHVVLNFNRTENKATVLESVDRFLHRIETLGSIELNLRDADKSGYTYREYESLGKKLSLFSWKHWFFKAQRMALGTVGRLSRGVQIGFEAGFDSGVSLDHVYENTPEGITPLGRFIDRFYLDAIGWKGIRQRRVNMIDHLSRAIDRAVQEGRKVRVLDVAAGAGRYVLETVRDHPQAAHVEVELRDFHQHNLDKAKQLAKRWDVKNVKFVQHDAFADESYADIEGKFDIVIVSGLLELFPANDQVRQALAGVDRALKGGGELIYTNQPWHPQLELIARVLPSHQGGDDWVMRRRTQREMDQLVEDVGLQKMGMDIDHWGIFSVSTATKRL